MTESTTPIFAGVLCLRLAHFARKPVAEQARLRVQLETVVEAALARLPEADRIVLDATDGFVIVVLGNPAGALDVAERCLDDRRELPLCIGADYGPVAPVDAAAAAPAHTAPAALAHPYAAVAAGLIGDGIRSAGVAAGFAHPGQMLASRGFREALAAHTPARQAELRPAGTFSDASVRTHQLYLADRSGGVQRRRQLQAASLVAAAVLIVVAALLRANNYSLRGAPALVIFDVSAGSEVLVDGESHGFSPPLRQLELRAGRHALELRHRNDSPHQIELALAAGERRTVKHIFAPPALVLFDVQPGGDVFVDGEPQGTLPALRRLQLRAGPHALEVRFGTFPPLKLDVELAPGEQFVLKHAFALPATIVFDVKPGGEVFIDGQAKGALPMLEELQLDPGAHRVEVRYGSYQPLRVSIELQPGERFVLRHRFGAAPRRKGKDPTLMDKVKDVFGID